MYICTPPERCKITTADNYLSECLVSKFRCPISDVNISQYYAFKRMALNKARRVWGMKLCSKTPILCPMSGGQTKGTAEARTTIAKLAGNSVGLDSANWSTNFATHAEGACCKRERELNSVHASSWADVTLMDCLCQRLINPIKELQQARSNILLAGAPHEKTQGPMTVIKRLLPGTSFHRCVFNWASNCMQTISTSHNLHKQTQSLSGKKPGEVDIERVESETGFEIVSPPVQMSEMQHEAVCLTDTIYQMAKICKSG